MKKLNCILLILALSITNTFAQNKALRLNGKNEYAKVENLDLKTNTVTFSMWVKPEGTQNSFAGILLSQTGNKVGLIVRENNEFGYMWNDDQYWNISSGLYLPENEWSYIAVVIAPTKTTLYVNGETRTIKQPNNVVTFNDFQLGKDRAYTNRCFKGAIADLKIWNTCLTVDQLNESKVKDVLTEQLFAFWKFDGQTQIIANSGNKKQTLQCIGGTQNENSVKEWSKISVRKEFKFAPQMLKNDVDTLAKYLVETHADIYFKKPKPQFEKEISYLKNGITDSLTLNHFFVKVAPFVASLGDGHTGTYLSHYDNVFPCEVQLNLKKPYIKISDCLSTTRENAIPPQSEIITINGLHAKQILEKIMQYISGESEKFRLKLAEGAFPAYFYLLYPENSGYSIKYKHNNKPYSTHIKAVEVAEWSDFQRNKNAGIDSAPYQMSLRENNTVAYIDFRACIELERFKVFIDSCFTVIKEKKIEQLIIDVRSNGGGTSSIGNEFFQYISPVPFHQFQRSDEKHSPLENSANPQPAFEGKPYGFIHTYEGFKYIPLRENPKRYRGKIYLLTSSSTFSGGALFAQAFKYFKMGKIIGEETGGWIISFADYLTSKLPNSNLPFAVSFKKFYSVGAKKNDYHGTYPDVKIESDKALDYTLQLIRKKKLRK